MATHSSILAWKIYGQRSLAGYSPWSHKELDTAERQPAHDLYVEILSPSNSEGLYLESGSLGGDKGEWGHIGGP